MNKYKQFSLGIIVFLLGVVVLSSEGLAWGSRQIKKNKPLLTNKTVKLKDLGISLEQQKKVETICFENKLNSKELEHKIEILEMKLYHELRKENISKQTINNFIAELKELKSEKLEARVEFILKIKELLTIEQFDNFLERKAGCFNGPMFGSGKDGRSAGKNKTSKGCHFFRD